MRLGVSENIVGTIVVTAAYSAAAVRVFTGFAGRFVAVFSPSMTLM